MKEDKKNKQIEVVSGDGKDLDISPVRTHISASKPKIEEKKDKKIIIPKEEKK